MPVPILSRARTRTTNFHTHFMIHSPLLFQQRTPPGFGCRARERTERLNAITEHHHSLPHHVIPTSAFDVPFPLQMCGIYAVHLGTS